MWPIWPSRWTGSTRCRPPDPAPTPLPPLGRLTGGTGFRLLIPVVADWGVLEGELEKALGKLSKKGIPIADVGRVQPTFGKPAKAVRPGEAELARNPRARSATLRSAIRTAAPVAASFAPSSPRSSRA